MHTLFASLLALHTALVAPARPAPTPGATTPPAAAPLARIAVPPGQPTDQGNPVRTRPGVVEVRVGRARYRADESIAITVANGLPRSILAADHQTNCTIVTLERRVGARWVPVGGCMLRIATRQHAIGSGRGRGFELDLDRALNGPGMAGAPGGASGVGLYRVRFTYEATPSLGRGLQGVALSAPFRVTPAPRR